MILLAATVPGLAHAQDDEFERMRIAVGPQLVPAYPGADRISLGGYFDIDRAAEDEPFAFEAPTESFGFPVLEAGGIYFGPAVALTGKRKQSDTMPGLRTVGTTIEPGVAIQADIGEQFYGFVEVRRGIGGHDAWTGQLGFDYFTREADEYVLSLGPRLTWGDNRHSRAYFGVSEPEALATGLAPHDPKGGIQSLGAAASLDVPVSRQWGMSAYAGYQRMVGDAADSPVVRAFGSRDQWSGGVAVTYTFRRGR
jgi:outer membrane protein